MWPERAYFRLYHPKYPSKPASHFTNHKETTEDKVAGTGMFLSLHPRYPSKPMGHFTNHKGTREDKVAGSVMFFAFTIQSILQSLQVILRTTKEQKETKRP